MPADKTHLGPWLRHIVDRDPKAKEKKLFNLNLKGFLTSERIDQYKTHIRESLCQFGVVSDSGTNVQDPRCILTAIGTFTKAHHDVHSHVSTARTRPQDDVSTPARLWVLWHPSQTNRLVYEGNYGESEAVFPRLEGGRFVVQRNRESIFIPANWPHCVLTMEGSTLSGSDVHGSTPWDLPSVQSEVAAGADEKEAVEFHYERMKETLRSDDAQQHERCADVFLTNLRRDSCYWRNRSGHWNDKLVALFTDSWEKTGRCALCAATGSSSNLTSETGERERHVISYHLQNGGTIVPDVKRTSNIRTSTKRKRNTAPSHSAKRSRK